MASSGNPSDAPCGNCGHVQSNHTDYGNRMCTFAFRRNGTRKGPCPCAGFKAEDETLWVCRHFPLCDTATEHLAAREQERVAGV